MKKNIRYMIVALMAVAMLCELNGCSSNNNSEDSEQIITKVGDKVISNEAEDKQIATDMEDKNNVGQDSSAGTDEASQNEKSNNTEKATSGENLDVIEPDPADDDWYMKGSVYTDEKGNQLEVFFNDYGTLEFVLNGLSMYFTTVDNFEYENNWRVYTCDDGTMIVYYPGEPAHIEIYDGDYPGLYEEGGDRK